MHRTVTPGLLTRIVRDDDPTDGKIVLAAD
jgi:hypothetical protein